MDKTIERTVCCPFGYHLIVTIPDWIVKGPGIVLNFHECSNTDCPERKEGSCNGACVLQAKRENIITYPITWERHYVC